MLNQLGKWNSNSLLIPLQLNYSSTLSFSSPSLLHYNTISPLIISAANSLQIRKASETTTFRARRRVIYEEEEEEEDYGYNEEIAVLESYSQLMKDEILLVQAMVDQELVQVLIFKGFSSCLSSRTYSDLSRSVLPTRAVIKSIDRAKGPFDPSNIQYIEKGLTFHVFKTRLNLPN
ncbi:hypothetical protein ABFS82_05G047300 [Erythranthe guttata]|uniref:DUF7734 domain-containing protein n=1 Tax=Erythranthe guttata TaxID=4155 RepID=A0A022QN53_ERYGU|nr:PREDICTED: uncharacterized protein LOC105966024 [Erythranthe guttata]EYU30137.1 hypothetical protein MIMGU_mgv1a014872mg [Erythranthe guttata]|eukprot:XP_012846020.1 PREDICTED: uncharacterized protein LOC105966024 [Erythranthe guttata]